MANPNSITSNRFHNVSPAMLADLIGQLDKQAKAATAELETAKDAFKARGLLVANGETFAVCLLNSIRQTLDTNAVKSEMGQAWFDDHSRLGEVTTLRISVAKPVAIAA
jgi:hypothetical protein